MLDRLLGNLKFGLGIRGFLGRQNTLTEAQATIRAQIGRREETFLDLVERGIYGYPNSPYRKLLLHAGVELSDLTRMVREMGLEEALEALYDAGVYVTYEELKGRKPIRRGDLEFSAKISDFDNPLANPFWTSQSSGSREQGTRVYIDLSMMEHEATYVATLMDAHHATHRPLCLWRPMPPSSNGLGVALRYTRVGMRPLRWFSTERFKLGDGGWRGFGFLICTITGSWLARQPLPWPKFVPQDEAVVVARWLAEQKAAGTPALADVSTSGAARVSLAATQNGLDISGTLFRIGGEPYTPGKAKAVADAGALVVNRYAMVEAGAVGLGCSNPIAEDDMHITIDKLAVLSRDKPVGPDGETVPALVYTSLMPKAQTIMLNAESGDCATLEERNCGCPFWDLGYKMHISGLRGYDKLTSEGVTFMGSELYKLVEEVLPARFGGNPMDYQLVEEEDQGLPRVSIIVSNRVGQIDEKAVIDAVIEGLKSHYVVGATMANQWRQGNTLRVRRQDPYTSGTRKVLPLHIIRTPKASGNVAVAPIATESSVQESKS